MTVAFPCGHINQALVHRSWVLIDRLPISRRRGPDKVLLGSRIQGHLAWVLNRTWATLSVKLVLEL